MMKSKSGFSCTVSTQQAGLRLDKYLTGQIQDYTRSALGKLIHDGMVLVGGQSQKTGYRVRAGDEITITFPPPAPTTLEPEQVDFEILHEDDDILVLVKPPGIVVHPAAGHRSGTLVHGLLFHCDSLPGIDEQRPGIVHRLDKDTSGVMLVAKSDLALRKLSEGFRQRTIKKTYHAILLRCPREDNGRIVEPIGRHPVKRKKMAIRPTDGRYAATRYKVKERFGNSMCFVELDLETGRTHQIRVHMSSLGCPVAGDELYGGRIPGSLEVEVSRQLLHASNIDFTHPVSEESLSFAAPLWPDMELVLDRIRVNMVSNDL